MKAKLIVLVLLASVAVLGIAASPAVAAYYGLPQVATPDVAHVFPVDGSWWSGGYGWAGYTAYAAGTPIPGDDYVVAHLEWVDPDKALVQGSPQWDLFSLTVKTTGGVVVVRTTEAQSSQFWTKVSWDPILRCWCRMWDVPIGQLPGGTYQVTFVDHLTTTIVGSVLDENGDWSPPQVVKPYRDIYKASFTVE